MNLTTAISITKSRMVKAENEAHEWGQNSFLYLLPESDNPKLIRNDVWANYKWQKDKAKLIAVYVPETENWYFEEN